jgi:Putative auto-transporter adhesin, head GIN domain
MPRRRTLVLGMAGSLALAVPARQVRAAAPATATETREVSDFDAIAWTGVGEMSIEQTGRERLILEAEPAVLRKIVAQVRERRLSIGFAPGGFQTRLPIRFRLEVKALQAFESHGSGDARIGPLTTDRLNLLLSGSGGVQLARLTARTLRARIEGSSDLGIAAGRVESQQIAIAGSGDYQAGALVSDHAEVRIDGSGSASLHALATLNARVDGSGDVEVRGKPALTQRVSGSGSVTLVDR